VLHLYEFDYGSGDHPCYYSHYTKEQAEESFKQDSWVTPEQYRDLVTVREVPDDEELTYLNDNGTKTSCQTTAGRLANECHPGCCAMCDAHYC
jgi:hypothetical protein